MKKLALLVAGAAMIVAMATPSFAADETTITGEGKCGKCALKETAKCQNVVVVEGKDGKSENYYLVQNDVSKNFHENICKESKKVTVTGTNKKVEGKNEFTATKIEVAK
jgi:hypothetical protein